MGDIFKKMSHQVPGGFECFDIFLAANMTEPTLHLSIAIKAIFLGTFF